ncbi:MAG: hypothetical protein NC311_05575 [Muribaculaceae bacterium]|nr:hypothetical protein [Muribaculaceae bacterium]
MAKIRQHKGDHMRVLEDLQDQHGRLLARGESHEIIGEVEIIHKSKVSGKAVFTRKLRRNDLLVTGAVFLSEKSNNIRSSFLTNPIDYNLGIHTVEEIDRTSATVPQEQIVGICVGNGGCGDTYNTVHKVHRTDIEVPGMLPIRVVPLNQDLKGVARQQYFLRKIEGEYAYYYGKKFTVDREINVMYEDGTIVPTNVHLIGDSNGKFIKTFTKYTATLDEFDIREGFKLSQGSTMRSLVNSVGLATGYWGKAMVPPSGTGRSDPQDGFEEVFNCRMMTTLNTENSELKDSEATITYIYRLYYV